MVPSGQHSVNVTVNDVLDQTKGLQPGRYQIEVRLLQERIQVFGVPADATVSAPS